MLNEKAEYEFYLTDGYRDLLRRENLRSELSGVRAAMIVLARGFLDRCTENGIDDVSLLHRYTHLFLKAWVIGGDGIAEDIAQEMASYPTLIRDVERAVSVNLTDHIIRQDITLKLKDETYDSPTAIKAAMATKVGAWDNSMFSCGSKDSQNQMFFKAIIADALHKGALSNRVISLRSDVDHFGLYGKLAATDPACLLGIIGSYLQEKPDGQISAPMVMTRISNYIGVFASSKGKDRPCLPRLLDENSYTYNGQPLFTKLNVTGSSRKLIVNPDWIDDMDVHLEDADAPPLRGYGRYTDADLFPTRFYVQSHEPVLTR